MTRPNTLFGPAPWQQGSWDGRAAGNFIGGGMGSGLVAATALSIVTGAPSGLHSLLLAAGMVLVALGLLCVWFEIGRPWRALHVFFHPRRSWMTREAFVAPPLMAAAAASALGVALAVPLAALLALAYLYCQGRILQAAKGIPAWREPLVVPLIVVSGLAEGAGLFWLAATFTHSAGGALWWLFGVLLALRVALVIAWCRRLAPRLALQPLAAARAAGRACNAGSLLALALVLGVWAAPWPAAWVLPLQAVAGALAAGAGVAFKWTLVTRAAYNQGFAVAHLPVRGVPRQWKGHRMGTITGPSRFAMRHAGRLHPLRVRDLRRTGG